MLAALLLSTLAVAGATVPAAAKTAPERRSVTVEDELRRAGNEYAYGNYAEAVKLLEGLLYPMRLYSDAQVVEARRLLGLAHYLLGHEADVRTEFKKLLYLSPDHQLDPFAIAPPIIDLFETVRAELKPELDAIRARRADDAARVRPPPGSVRTVTRVVVQRSELAMFMPFGVGQFVNGDRRWGSVFAVSEALLLAANVAAYTWGRSLGNRLRVDGRRGYDPDEASLARGLLVSQFASLALFGVVWSAGVFHARLGYVSEVRTESVEETGPEPTVGVMPLAGGGAAQLGWRF